MDMCIYIYIERERERERERETEREREGRERERERERQRELSSTAYFNHARSRDLKPRWCSGVPRHPFSSYPSLPIVSHHSLSYPVLMGLRNIGALMITYTILGGSFVYLQWNGPQNPALIIETPIFIYNLN